MDDGVPTLSSSQTLTISVLDVNDEAPVFKQHLYEASVKENKNPGEFVTRVEAMDRDSGKFKMWEVLMLKTQIDIISTNCVPEK